MVRYTFMSLCHYDKMIFDCQNFEQAKYFRSWNFRTLSLRSSELSFRASERLLRTSVSLLGQKLLSGSLFFKLFLGKRCNRRRPDPSLRGSTPQNLWGSLHFCRLHFWYGVQVVSAVSQPCGNSNCHERVRRRRRTSSIVRHYFTRGRYLMVLGTRARLKKLKNRETEPNRLIQTRKTRTRKNPKNRILAVDGSGRVFFRVPVGIHEPVWFYLKIIIYL